MKINNNASTVVVSLIQTFSYHPGLGKVMLLI